MKDNVLRTGLGILRLIIIVLGGALALMIMTKSGGEETYAEGMEAYGGSLDTIYSLTLIALVVCAAAAVLFGIVYFFMNLKSRMGSLIGIIAFAVIALISIYGLADSTVLAAYEKSGITVSESESMLSGGGIIFVYVLGALAIGTIVWTEAKKLIQ